LVAAGLDADLGGLSRQLRRCLYAPLPDLELVLPPSEVFALSPQPLLGFAELLLTLGERSITVRKLPLCLLLKR
jgi:hypothetical protein